MPNLAKLPLDADEGLVRVVVETPKGSTQKIDYDADLECFVVKRRMPAGIAYPFHFGFLPSTLGEDGDPVDAIVLSDQPAFTGLVVPCRVVAAIKVAQTEKKKTLRNDRYIAVPDCDVAHAAIVDVRDIARDMRAEIEAFLKAAIELEEKEIRFLGWDSRRAASRTLRTNADVKGMRRK